MKNLSLLVASSAVLLTCFTESSHALSFLNPNIKEIKNVNNSKLSDALVEFKNKHEELVSQLTTENLEKDETIKSMQKKYYDETTNLKNKISHLHNVIKQQQDSINKQNVELQKYKSKEYESENTEIGIFERYEQARDMLKSAKQTGKAMKRRSYGDEYSKNLSASSEYFKGEANPYEGAFREVYNMREQARKDIAEIERRWGSGGTAKASHTKSGTGTLLPPTGFGVGLFSRGG